MEILSLPRPRLQGLYATWKRLSGVDGSKQEPQSESERRKLERMAALPDEALDLLEQLLAEGRSITVSEIKRQLSGSHGQSDSLDQLASLVGAGLISTESASLLEIDDVRWSPRVGANRELLRERLRRKSSALASLPPPAPRGRLSGLAR